MALNQIEQIKKLIEDKKRILIAFDKHGKGDAIASSVALFLFLRKFDKKVDIVCGDFLLPQQYKFLRNSKQIKSELEDLHKFVITVDSSKTPVKELSYDVQGDKLRIFLSPKRGMIDKSMVRTAQSEFNYDLIFVLDTPDLKSLGSVYMEASDFFDKTPIVNIDHKASNEHFGHINHQDMTACTTAEVLFSMFKQMKPEFISKKIATALLTGMISETNSFKSNHVKPHTLANASELIELGADRNFIIKNLYYTKSISTFKLWGNALSNLKHDKNTNLVWTTITREDFVRSGASEQDLPAIIDELISNSPEAKIILVLHEHAHQEGSLNHQIHGIIQTNAPHDASEIGKKYKSSGGPEQVNFTVTGGQNLAEVEKEVIEHIKQIVRI